MKNLPVKVAAVLLIILSSSSIVFSESNFDFFLGGSGRYQDVVVREISNSDTLILEDGEVIKLIGVNASALSRKRKKVERDEHGFALKEEVSPVDSIEERAFQFMQKLLEGKHVRLEFDVEKKDEKFNTLGYVFLLSDGTFVNAEVLRQGFGNLRIRPSNIKYAKELKEAYQEANREKRGLLGR